MTNILHTFTNKEDGVSSFVFVSNLGAGGFGVSLRDDDSGDFVPMSFHGFKTEEAAISKAREVLGA